MVKGWQVGQQGSALECRFCKGQGAARQYLELASLLQTSPLVHPACPQELIDSNELNAILGITK